MLNSKNKNISLISTAVLILWALLVFCINSVFAANTPNRSLTISDSKPAQSSVSYTFKFDIVGSYSIGSIVFEVCNEDPLPNQPCTAPAGFDSNSRVLSNQQGEVGFSIHPSTTNHRIVLTRAPQISSVSTLEYTLSNITNPSITGSYYARIYTYSSLDGSGVSIDDGGIAFAINNAINYNAEVPPFLYLCHGKTISGYDCTTAIGAFLDFGEFTTNATSYDTSQMMVSTNAEFGYNVSIYGLTLTSGNNTIPAMDTLDTSRVGVSQFGVNLRDNSIPNVGTDNSFAGLDSVGYVSPNYNIPNRFKFSYGDLIAGSNNSTNFNKYTISYIVNVSSAQRPGVYNTTLTLNCLANF